MATERSDESRADDRDADDGWEWEEPLTATQRGRKLGHIAMVMAPLAIVMIVAVTAGLLALAAAIFFVLRVIVRMWVDAFA